MNNELIFNEVEALAVRYAKAERAERELIFEQVYQAMKKYLFTCLNNAVDNVKSYNLSIPQEDFESSLLEALWRSLESFSKEGNKPTFRSIVVRRLKLSEPAVWRKYRRKTNKESDKDGYTYNSARWVSLHINVDEDSESTNRFGRGRDLAEVSEFGEMVSAETEFFEDYEVEEILNEFSLINKRYAKVIRYMYFGYSGDDLAVVTGESNNYDAKMRKLVQRSKESFKHFMDERTVI